MASLTSFIFTLLGLVVSIWASAVGFRDKIRSAKKENDLTERKYQIKVARIYLLVAIVAFFVAGISAAYSLYHTNESDRQAKEEQNKSQSLSRIIAEKTKRIEYLNERLLEKSDSAASKQDVQLAASTSLLDRSIGITKLQSINYYKQIELYQRDSLNRLSDDSLFIVAAYYEIYNICSQRLFNMNTKNKDTIIIKDDILRIAREICFKASTIRINRYLLTHPKAFAGWDQLYKDFSELIWKITGYDRTGYSIGDIESAFFRDFTNFSVSCSPRGLFEYPAKVGQE